MAFAPVSLQREYWLASAFDPALDLPDVPDLPEDAPPAAVEERDRALKDREHKLTVARQTGRWHEITKHGASPTLFKMAPIHGRAVEWLHGETRRRKLTESEITTLALRLALRDVQNFGGMKLVKSDFERIDGLTLLKEEALQPLWDLGHEPGGDASIGSSIIFELGAIVWERATQGVPPL